MPWHFWEDKGRLTGVPTRSLCQTNIQFAVTPLALTPFVPFRAKLRAACAGYVGEKNNHRETSRRGKAGGGGEWVGPGPRMKAVC